MLRRSSTARDYIQAACSITVSSDMHIWLVDPEIDRSSRSFDDGVELSRRISEKSSRSIESIVRL